jgi:hypothetical protein
MNPAALKSTRYRWKCRNIYPPTPKISSGKSNCQAGVSVSPYKQIYTISKPFMPLKLLRLIIEFMPQDTQMRI